MPRESTSPPTSTIRVRSQVRHPSLLMVQSIGRLVSLLNLSMLSLIPDIIFNTNPTKNRLNSVDSVEILSGLDWNYELKEKKQSKNIFFFPFQITQKATKIEKSLKKKNESFLQKKNFFKTMTVKEKEKKKASCRWCSCADCLMRNITFFHRWRSLHFGVASPCSISVVFSVFFGCAL